jgi:hypothetical protein
MKIHNFQQLTSVQYNSTLSSLKSGSEVTLKLLSKSGKFWQGSINGKILSFKSDLALDSGKTIKVKVQWAGKDLILRYIPSDKQNLRPFIEQNALPDNALSRSILQQLRALQIPYTDNLFQAIYKRNVHNSSIKKRSLQLQILLVEKGFDIEVEDADAIQSFLFSPGRKQLNDKQKNILRMFNSVSSKSSHWIFSEFQDEKTGIHGKTGIRYSVKTGQSDFVFLIFEINNENWIFSLDDSAIQPFLRIFSSKKKLSAFENSEIALLLNKLYTMGVKSDNTVYEADNFELLPAGKRGININELA